MTLAPREALDSVFVEHRASLLATLIRILGDFDLAEDALQDAATVALIRWERDGVPANPRAWLLTTSRNSAIDRIRRTALVQRKARDLQVLREIETAPAENLEPFREDKLRLIFTCCHPALPMEGRVALTLRMVGGLIVPEIARAFLIQEAAVQQRIVRAKRKIRDAGIPYRVPPPELLGERVDGVLTVIYLIFNEGYSATAGSELTRAGLTAEAIRLCRAVVEMIPDEPEARGLLALMLYHEARRESRVAGDGSLVLLDDQDRSLWDRDSIAEANALLAESDGVVPGRFRLQAEIAGCHANARVASNTDWSRIATLYDALYTCSPTSVVALNRAVAHALATSPEVGLGMIDDIEGLDAYYLYHSSRADLLRRAGRNDEARAAYERAITLATNETERAFLEGRRGDLDAL